MKQQRPASPSPRRAVRVRRALVSSGRGRSAGAGGRVRDLRLAPFGVAAVLASMLLVVMALWDPTAAVASILGASIACGFVPMIKSFRAVVRTAKPRLKAPAR